MSNKPLTLPLLAAGLAAAVLMLAAPARAHDHGPGKHVRESARPIVRHERREIRHERREIRHERREHRRERRHLRRERHGAAHLIGYTVGATVGYAVGYTAGVHHSRPYRTRPACTPVSKIAYDGYGRPIRIGGTMCFDRYGVGYIVPGSRYVIG